VTGKGSIHKHGSSGSEVAGDLSANFPGNAINRSFNALAGGAVLGEGTIPSARQSLDGWIRTLSRPWTVAMEATMFTGWIYDHLLPHASAVKVAHPLMLRAIAAAKKKNDRIDASKIADCLRCNFLPECYMASTEVRERRGTLRYRKLLVRQNVQLRNKVSQMLMESGVVYNKQKLHKVGYFKQLMTTNQGHQ
jgi:transposase